MLRTKPKSKFSALVEIDEQILGVLSNKALRNFSLLPDQEIQIEPDLAEALKTQIVSDAWLKFLDWLAFQERTVSQSRMHLTHLPLAPDIVEDFIDKACRYNYLNDERFAILLIESLIERAKSLPEIKNKLYEKKIPPLLIDKFLFQIYDQETQYQVLEKLVDQFYQRWQNLEPEKRKTKVCEYLARRGFNYYKVIEMYQRIENAQENNC